LAHRPHAVALFPYTTLFRSQEIGGHGGVGLEGDVDAAQLEQVPGALQGILERTVCLVHARGPLKRGAPLGVAGVREADHARERGDRKSTRVNSSHVSISYAV